VKFCQFVASVYPHILTSINFSRSTVLIIFTISSFSKLDCLDFIATDEWPQSTQPQSTGLLGLATMLQS